MERAEVTGRGWRSWGGGGGHREGLEIIEEGKRS